jgi:predicted alpha-1,2-mannosidase
VSNATRLAVVLLLALPPAAGASIREVDPYIGVDGGGNVAPGPSVPFGFARPGPDTAQGSTAGYTSGHSVLGFGQTHVSGVAGNAYGNFRLSPISGRLRAGDLGSRVSGERARPGRWRGFLDRHRVAVELTATRLAALHRYRGARHVILDASSVVQVPEPQIPLATRLRVVGRDGVEGSARLGGTWNRARYKLYFALRFDRPFARAGIFEGSVIGRRRAIRTGRNVRAGAWMSFRGAEPLVAGVGLSFRSVARARRNLAGEAPKLDFDGVRERAERTWTQTLGRLTVRGGGRLQRRLFRTALYRAHLMPHELTGENAWWRSRSPHYEDYFAVWDTFRTLHPLLTVLQPRRQAAMVESLVDTYRHTGWMPDGRVAGANGLTQVGSNAGVLVSDALSKGLRGIDYRTAYRAMVKDAELETTQPLRQGRQLADYKRLGYVSTGYGRSASRTLEYAYDDFALAQVAARLGEAEAAGKYLDRSRNWSTLWDPGTRAIRPREGDGKFVAPFSPDTRHFGFEAPFYEGSARQWSTFVPHDVRGLVFRLGGDAAAVQWLDELFDGRRYDPSNEHDLLAPYLYIHAGRPDLTAERVRRVLATAYRAGRRGWPGNDDAGTLSAWYVWSAIGLYPNGGQPFYYLTSPIFRRSTIRLSRRRTFTIETRGAGTYVQGATLGGTPLDRAWLTHQELVRGGRLVLVLGPRPSRWGRSARPPSL